MTLTERVAAAYLAGYTEATDPSPKRTRYRSNVLRAAYAEGQLSGQHHHALATERARHYAAQITHARPQSNRLDK